MLIFNTDLKWLCEINVHEACKTKQQQSVYQHFKLTFLGEDETSRDSVEPDRQLVTLHWWSSDSIDRSQSTALWTTLEANPSLSGQVMEDQTTLSIQTRSK